MSPERWQQIEEIFQDALDLPLSKREKFIAEKCGDDAELKSEVEKLLLQFEDASSFIETPAYSDSQAGVLSSLLQFDDEDPMLGTLLGSYRIEREIGRGGMGAVYESIRADGEFRRKAAIKIVKRGMDTDFILRRFRNERQILATLEHPYITRLLDGGTTDDGRPYFVMDYIEGLPLYRYSDKKRLTIDERLKLFIKICEAVEYAHTNLVIHRDLKPSNILITNDGTPRLLDFGIAKLLNPELASDTLQPTATAMRMMTIDYASPEQINGEKVTFATDIYSLGVILFELLTGHRPYRFPNRTPHEIARVICEEPPMLPSDAITRSEDTLPIIHVDQEALTIRHLAELRKNSPDKLREILRGNLDNITLKALCKSPDERYQSVKRILQDIEKHLEGKPVSTPFYFPTNRVDTALNIPNTRLIAVLPLKLLNFAATENTDENYLSIGLADAIISRLTSVRDFTVRPTSSISGYEKSDVDPLQAGRELGVDFVLDGRIKKYGQKLRVSLQMLDVQKGSTTWAGQFDEKFSDVLALEDAISEQVAEALISQNTGENLVKLGRRGTDNAQAYDAYMRGRFFWNQFNPETFPKALESFQRAVELDPKYALAYAGIADYYNWATIFGFYAPREGYQKTRAAAKKALEIDDQLCEAISILGFITAFSDYNWAEAERLFKRSLEMNPNYGLTHEWYSALLAGMGRTEEACTEIMRSLELDPLSLRTVTLTAWTLYQLHRYPEALTKIDEIFEMSPGYYQGYFQLGNILNELGRAEEAVAAGRKGMELAPGLGYMNYKLCFALTAVNRFDEAREVLRNFETMSPGPEINSYHFGMCYAALGETDLAFRWLDKAVEDRHPWCVWLATEPKLDRLRDDERFDDLLRKTNRQYLIAKDVEGEKRSIAVLPLQFIGEIETGDAYLSIGLADAMITRLSQVRRLLVRPTNSVLRFAETQDSVAAGHELGVDYVLTGMIRPAGKRIRISAQLLDIKANTTIWSEKFDEEFTEVLELEDKVAEKVAKLLIPQLTAEEEQNLAKRKVKNVAAYEAYLRGKYHFFSFTPDDFAKAVSYFEKAVKLDPNYALAYSALSDVYFTLAAFASKSPAESFAMFEEMAQKAIELDDSLGEAYSNLGMVKSYNFDLESGEKLFKRGLELNPNQPNGYVWQSVFLTIQGKSEEAIAQARKAYKLDPTSGFHQYHYIWVLYHNRHFDEAVDLITKADETAPNFAHGQGIAGWIFRHLDDKQEAIKRSEKAAELSPETGWLIANLAATHAKFGGKEKAVSLLRQIEAEKDRYVSPYCLAQVYLYLSDKEKTFEMLEKSVADRDVWYPWITSDAELDRLRIDPRFIKLIQRINPSTKHEETIHQSQIPTKIFTAGELKEINVAAKAETDKPSFFFHHRFKFAAFILFSLLSLVAYATGILTIDFQDRRFGLEATDTAHASRSVAVLPFKNETNSLDNNFICEGLSENLISRLQSSSNIRVLPRSTSFKYKTSEISPEQAGAEMQVDAVLTGKLLKNGPEIEIAIELIEVKNGSRIWGFGYRGGETDLLFLQNKMGEDVSEKFQISDPKKTFGKSYTENSQSFEEYLKGEYHRQKATPEDTKKAVEFYKKALELDPNYALAHQGLALAYRLAPAYGTLTPNQAYPLAKESAMKALAIDPNLGSAHIPLASIRYVYDWDFKGAEAEYKQAIQLAPNNSEAHSSYGNFLVAMGRSDEAINELKIAQQFEPNSSNIASNIAWALYIAGRFDEAETQTRQVLAREPNFSRAYMSLGEIYVERGKFDEAIAAFQKAKQIAGDPLTEMAIGHVYAVSGRRAEALKIAIDLEAKVMKKEVSPFLPAVVYAGLNDRDKSFYWLERAFQERSNWLTLAKVGRRLKPLHADPRFDDLLKRIGFDQ